MKLLSNPKVKYGLAAVGVVYIIAIVVYVVHAKVAGEHIQTAPSELEAHPERQEEIIAQRKAAEMKDQLNLSDEQAQKVAEIFQKQHTDGNDGGDFRDRRQAMRDDLAQVLTPEQQAKMDESRGRFGGPGGPGGRGDFMSRLTPERIESIKQGMTPDQQSRLENKIQQWQERRAQRREGRGPGGPGGQGGRGGPGGQGNGDGQR
jgi:Spy/CpxP family protein refolding chaperone